MKRREPKIFRPELARAVVGHMRACKRSNNYMDAVDAVRDAGVRYVDPDNVWEILEAAWRLGILRKYDPAFNDRQRYQAVELPELDWEGWTLARRWNENAVDVVLEVVEFWGMLDWFAICAKVAEKGVVDVRKIQFILDDAVALGWIEKRKTKGVGVYDWVGRW